MSAVVVGRPLEPVLIRRIDTPDPAPIELALVTEPKEIVTVVGPRGVPGPEGPPGTYAPSASILLRATAAVVVSGHRVVTAVGPGRVAYPDLESRASLDLVQGVTIAAAAAEAAVDIVRAGLVEHGGWSFTPGSPLFAGAGGVITAAEPFPFARRIAVAVSATAILVDLQPTITRS